MKKERILLYEDKARKSSFQDDVENTQNASNDLINLFEAFQPYRKIKSIEDFMMLIADPVGLFDKTLQSFSGIDTTKTGGRIPKPEVLAQLFEIDRDSYVSIITGELISEAFCKSCAGKQIKIKSGQKAISLNQFSRLSKYLTWETSCRFLVNESEVSKYIERYDYYCNNEKEIKEYKYLTGLIAGLNQLYEKNLIGSEGLQRFADSMRGKVNYTPHLNKLFLDEVFLWSHVQGVNEEIETLK